MSGPLLEVEDLEVRYGAVSAVRELSFEVGEGEIVGLIGPNGAGKTTTLLAIMGGRRCPRATCGSRAARSAGGAPEDIARSGVALVPEGRRIYGDLTVEDNLRLGLSARRDRSGAAAELDAVFELFPVVREFRRRPAGACRVGSSNSWRSRGPSSPGRDSSCSTSRLSGSPRRSSTSSSTPSPRSGVAG